MKQDAQIRKFLADRGIEHVKIGVIDTDGILRGKYLSRDKFLSAIDKNLGFCDVILGWDSNDQLYDNTRFTGWHTAYPDATVRVLPDTQRDIPFEPKTVFFSASSPGAPNRSARAARCGVCSSAPRRWATRSVPQPNTNSSCSKKHRNPCARKATGS